MTDIVYVVRLQDRSLYFAAHSPEGARDHMENEGTVTGWTKTMFRNSYGYLYECQLELVQGQPQKVTVLPCELVKD